MHTYFLCMRVDPRLAGMKIQITRQQGQIKSSGLISVTYKMVMPSVYGQDKQNDGEVGDSSVK